MKTESHICSALKVDSFDVGSAPATIPPAPASGVTLRAAVARTHSP
jgi:hypothetical protein